MFTVTTAADAGPGSLRQAILDANAVTGADSITFAIGTGVQTITPATPLPAITGPVTIDGTTQPGFAGTRTYDVGDHGAAFGAANGTSVSVLDLLLAVDARSHTGLLYDADGSGTISAAEAALRAQANDLFAALNELGGI